MATNTLIYICIVFDGVISNFNARQIQIETIAVAAAIISNNNMCKQIEVVICTHRLKVHARKHTGRQVNRAICQPRIQMEYFRLFFF